MNADSGIVNADSGNLPKSFTIKWNDRSRSPGIRVHDETEWVFTMVRNTHELDNLLHVSTKDALRKLVREARLDREKLAGQFLYCAADAARKAEQLLARRILLGQPGALRPLPQADMLPDELRAAIVLFFSLLDEKQRRLYAGLESLKTGRGGDPRIAELLGLDVGTVARGRRELLEQDVEVERVRRAGGGRKRLEKKPPK